MNGDPRQHGPADGPIDWEDRLVDRALCELHGERPPDLAAAVLRRLGGDGRGPAPARSVSRSRWPLLLLPLLSAAALLVVALTWRPAQERIAGVQLEVAVTTGALALTGEAPPQPLLAGARSVLVLRRGDRLRTAADEPTDVWIGPFGMVRGEPSTELEVVDMDVTLRNGWVAAGSLTFAVVAGAASWHLITHRGQAEAGEVLRLETPAGGDLAMELASARTENARLQDEKQQLALRLQQLEEQHARRALPAETPEVPDAPATAAATEPATAAGPVFDDPRFADMLRNVDWNLMGKVAGEMAGPLLELAKALEEGGELPIDLAVKIAKLNMELVGQLPELMKAELPGAGPNGVYTHPLVVGNQIASLLQNGGLPLNDAQRDALAGIVRRFALENEGIHGGTADFELDRVVAEVAMKDRMYEELAQQLGPQQLAMLYPEGAGAFDGTSLFRSGLVWQAFANPVPAANPADYAASAGRHLQERLGLDAGAAEQVRQILGQVAGAAPGALWTPSSPVERSPQGRFLRSGRALRAAEVQQQWMRRILREVPLSAAQREQLRQLQRVFVPLPR